MAEKFNSLHVKSLTTNSFFSSFSFLEWVVLNYTCFFTDHFLTAAVTHYDEILHLYYDKLNDEARCFCAIIA